MRWPKFLDPFYWLPGPELTAGMLGYGLEDFLPEGEEDETDRTQ
jgi:hypothetical protein